MKTLMLTDVDVRGLIRSVGIDRLMDDLIARLEAAFRSIDGSTEIPVRTGFHYETPTSGLIEWMPIKTPGGPVVIKVVGYHPSNPAARRLPTVISTLFAYDTATGHLAAVMDGTLLTAMRTGAASAVASRWMARPDSRSLGLIGCGAQAVTQLHALGRLFALDRVLIHDTDASAMASFPSRVRAFIGQSTEIRVADADTIMRDADIVCTSTSVAVGQGPVVDPLECKPWLHVNAVGSDFPGKTELSKAFLEESFVCPDTLDQASAEGECQQLDAGTIPASIVDIVRGKHSAAALQARRTVFDSTGWAIEDQVVMSLALEWAEELGIGREVAIECLSEDPRDPYRLDAIETAAPSLVRPSAASLITAPS